MRPAPLALSGLALVMALPASGVAAGWGPAVRVAPPGAIASPDVSAGAAGRTLAAWVRGEGGASRIEVATGARGRWTAPRALSGLGAARPRTALNALGDAAVAWIGRGGVAAAVRHGPAGRWSVGRVAVPGGAVRDLRLAIDRVGRPSVLWLEADGSGVVTRIATRPSVAAGWGVRPASVGSPGAPAAGLAPSGAVAAWAEDGRAMAARTVRGAFEAPQDLGHGVTGRPAAAIGRTGAVVAAWATRLPGGTSVVEASARAVPGRAWTDPEDVGIGTGPVAGVGEDADALVAWSLAGPGAPQGIDAVTRTGNGGQWRASTVLPARSCACGLRVAGVAVDGDGTALVAWRRDVEDGDPGGGVASLSPGTEDWVRAGTGGGRLDATPAVAAAGGTAVALWATPGAGVKATLLRR